MSGRATLDAREWTSFFNFLRSATNEPTKLLMAAMSTRGYRGIIEKFKNEEGPDGKWTARSPETQKRYAKIGAGDWKTPKGAATASYNPANKLLQLTGKLRQSIMPSNLAKQTRRIGKFAIEIFSPVPYSDVHDSGGKNMPKREFMWLSDSEKNDMTTIMAGMVAEGRI